MTLTQFLHDNRDELDCAIRRLCPNVHLSDKERRLWVRNDEGLYRWARSEGVKL